MSGKFSRWMRSKAGTQTLIGVLAVLIVVAVVGQLAGWWAALAGLVTGTAGPPPPPTYPAPEGGYTCLPTCDVTDGKFLSMPGEEMASFGGESAILWISVPGDTASFEVGFFDGDSGKDNTGNINYRGGNWDNTTAETTYTLYADPLKNRQGSTVVGQWRGNQDPMPNNDWYNVTVNNVPEAQGPSRHYFYRLEITRPVEGVGINALKLRSTGYIVTGQANLVNVNFAIVGMLATMNDVYVLWPEFQSFSNMGPSTYTGDWQFYFYVPNDTEFLDLWDGDFDRGTSAGEDADTDDFNTEGVPLWASIYAVPERAGGVGAPADNYPNPVYKREPPVRYDFIDPDGVPIYQNDEPSGTEEWENFIISTDANRDPDLLVERIQPGFYTLHIEGLDLHNTVWLRLDYAICDAEDGCGPPEWPEGTCPRTIGYWKNNVKKVLIEGRTRGVQESRESLEWGLRNVALASPIFRHGINVNAPAAIGDAIPLTAQEANMILQRDQKTYPGGKDAANSMLARALQQDLASWLNLATGKVGPTTVVELNVHGGVFQGTLWEALQEAQDIVLNGGDLERAKDIGDQINNGNLGENADYAECVEDAYKETIPKDKQPPKYDDMPEAPTPEPPPPPDVCAQDPEGCPACTGNPCGSIFSPGYWKNYANHYTDEEFLALIQKTMHYSGLSIAEALDILDNNADQYHRHLLSAELNVAADPGLGLGIYNFDDGGLFVLQVLDQAYYTEPANADADLTSAVLYLGAEGEGQGSCRVSCTP